MRSSWVFLGRRPVSRRWLVTQAGAGTVAIAVLGLAGCSRDETPNGAAGTPSGRSGSDDPGGEATSGPSLGAELTWQRVELGFVSAFVLVRGDEAAVVDTGVEGSEQAIGDVLASAGPGWAGVRHVVLTHRHPDHAGSVGGILDLAAGATAYVGAEDLAGLDVSGLRPLADGDEVFGTRIVATPGHTAGHMAVFDPDTGVLVAGDALTNPGTLSGPSPEFTEDMDVAVASVRALAELAPSIVLVGHGEPVTEGAADALAALAASLG